MGLAQTEQVCLSRGDTGVFAIFLVVDTREFALVAATLADPCALQNHGVNLVREILLQVLCALDLQSLNAHAIGLFRVQFPHTSQMGPGFNSTSPDLIREIGSNGLIFLASVE